MIPGVNGREGGALVGSIMMTGTGGRPHHHHRKTGAEEVAKRTNNIIGIQTTIVEELGQRDDLCDTMNTVCVLSVFITDFFK